MTWFNVIKTPLSEKELEEVLPHIKEELEEGKKAKRRTYTKLYNRRGSVAPTKEDLNEEMKNPTTPEEYYARGSRRLTNRENRKQ